VRAGKLKNKIVVEYETTGRDDFGGVTTSWLTHSTYWSSVAYLGGTESLSSDQVRGNLQVQFTVRFDPTVSRITPDMRVIYAGRTFDIQSAVNTDEMSKEAIITTTERGGGASD
jgi:SPP1 family predicted phage head-tail adaptor